MTDHRYCVLVLKEHEVLDYGPTDDMDEARRWIEILGRDYEVTVFDGTQAKRPTHKTSDEFHGRAHLWSKSGKKKPQIVLVEYDAVHGDTPYIDALDRVPTSEGL